MAREIPLPHPGEILKDVFLDPMGVSIYAAAKAIGVSRSQFYEKLKRYDLSN